LGNDLLGFVEQLTLPRVGFTAGTIAATFFQSKIGFKLSYTIFLLVDDLAFLFYQMILYSQFFNQIFDRKIGRK
jgi:hypothetical protein